MSTEPTRHLDFWAYEAQQHEHGIEVCLVGDRPALYADHIVLVDYKGLPAYRLIKLAEPSEGIHHNTETLVPASWVTHMNFCSDPRKP